MEGTNTKKSEAEIDQEIKERQEAPGRPERVQ